MASQAVLVWAPPEADMRQGFNTRVWEVQKIPVYKWGREIRKGRQLKKTGLKTAPAVTIKA